MTDDRLIASLMAFLMSVAVTFLLVGMIGEKVFPSGIAAWSETKSLANCERRADTRLKKPWTVIAMPELNRIVASGPIGWGSAEALEDVIRRNPKLRLLQLDSRGGLVHEENLLIEVVLKHGLDTLVIERCGSACTGVFVAGKRRYVTPDVVFGFHRSGYCGIPENAPWSPAEYMTAIHYRERGVSDEFAELAQSAPFETIWRPSPLELKKANFATHWWSDRPAEYTTFVHQ